MKTAITGGIGSGKSYVCARLAARGIAVYDCDSAAKRLINTSPDIRQRLTELIGTDTYTPEGRLNKATVAAFLLASEANAQAVNAIVHPAVAQDFIASGAEWMECALLFESGFDQLVDRTIAVVAPESVRIERITARDGISESKAREWIVRQWPQEKVRLLADYELTNDGQQDVDAQLDGILEELNRADDASNSASWSLKGDLSQ